MQYNHLSPFYFLHVPKTAGTSLRFWFEEMFDQDECCPYFHAYLVRDRDADDLARYKFFSGHLTFEFLIRYGKRFNLASWTILRDPAERALSELRFVQSLDQEQVSEFQRNTWARGWLIKEASRGTAPEIFVQEEYASGHANRQMRYLLSNAFAATNECEGDGDGGMPHANAADDLNAAESNLRSLQSFGILESLDRSLLMFAADFGLPPRQMGIVMNASRKGHGGKDKEVRRAAAAANSLDARLYDYARGVFDERWTALLKSFSLQDTPEGRTALERRLTGRFAETDRGLPRIAAATIRQSDGLILDGWHGRFFYEPDGKTLRWSGPTGRSTVWIPIDRTSARTVRAEIAYALSDAIRDGLAVAVDGAPAPVRRGFEQKADASWQMVIEFEVSEVAANPQYTQIDFLAPQTKTLEDGRVSAFAMGDLSIG